MRETRRTFVVALAAAAGSLASAATLLPRGRSIRLRHPRGETGVPFGQGPDNQTLGTAKQASALLDPVGGTHPYCSRPGPPPCVFPHGATIGRRAAFTVALFGFQRSYRFAPFQMWRPPRKTALLL